MPIIALAQKQVYKVVGQNHPGMESCPVADPERDSGSRGEGTEDMEANRCLGPSCLHFLHTCS